MRYECERCGQWVKDKFILGLLHFCELPDLPPSSHIEDRRLDALVCPRESDCEDGIRVAKDFELEILNREFDR